MIFWQEMKSQNTVKVNEYNAMRVPEMAVFFCAAKISSKRESFAVNGAFAL